MSKTKPFNISKKEVITAWERVKQNKGAYGVDRESIKDFELNLKDNLYKLWNRMSSGTYFPPAVRAVEIPKADGRKRMLGIPTVTDRIAQGVVKSYLEAIVEPKFSEDSYGYRPGKSAIEAVGVARERCWREDWCIDLDIKGFFDNIDHGLMMKAVKFHTKEKWIHLYIDRWLKAPVEMKDGKQLKREKGTPQGGPVSPLLANIFMHHAFDEWIKRRIPEIKYERYADDILAHCSSLGQAEKVLEGIEERLKECFLEINPGKTKIVYCKSANRKGSYKYESFDYLGYTFRPRLSKNKRGGLFVGFTPAISRESASRIRREIRSWKIHLRSDKKLEDLAKVFNQYVQGWVNYYGRYCKSAMDTILKSIEGYLVRWVMRKYKRYRGSKRKARRWLESVSKREPSLFVHWKLLLGSVVR